MARCTAKMGFGQDSGAPDRQHAFSAKVFRDRVSSAPSAYHNSDRFAPSDRALRIAGDMKRRGCYRATTAQWQDCLRNSSGQVDLRANNFEWYIFYDCLSGREWLFRIPAHEDRG